MSTATRPPAFVPETAGGGAPRRDRVAARLALAGAVLGVAAGMVELTLGPSVRAWVGDKQDTTRLGLTTTILSLGALWAAAALHRPSDGGTGRRGAITLGLVVPALVCFTTVGRLWYLPGALLLASAALVIRDTRRGEVTLDQRRWRTGLLVLCGAFSVFLGATAQGLAGVLGILGGVLVWFAARAAPRAPRTAYVLLVCGALPFAAATWWSVVTPMTALLTLVVGHGLIRTARPDRA